MESVRTWSAVIVLFAGAVVVAKGIVRTIGGTGPFSEARSSRAILIHSGHGGAFFDFEGERASNEDILTTLGVCVVIA